MKKLFVAVMLLMMVIGCAGLNTSQTVNVATDAAFVGVLQNNPDHKAEIVQGLADLKTFLSGEVTYDSLIIEIAKRFPNQYTAAAAVLTSYLEADKPVFETYLPLMNDYKAGFITKIDRLISLAGII